MGKPIATSIGVLLLFASSANTQIAHSNFEKRLQEADRLAWLTNWDDAVPIYAEVEQAASKPAIGTPPFMRGSAGCTGRAAPPTFRRLRTDRACGVIGTIRRECLNHVIVVNEGNLRRHLNSFVASYHQSRTHLGLQKDAPVSRPVKRPATGLVVALPEVGGLHHRYERRAA